MFGYLNCDNATVNNYIVLYGAILDYKRVHFGNFVFILEIVRFEKMPWHFLKHLKTLFLCVNKRTWAFCPMSNFKFQKKSENRYIWGLQRFRL